MAIMSLSPAVATLGWPSRNPELFDELSNVQARSVHDAVANSVLEAMGNEVEASAQHVRDHLGSPDHPDRQLADAMVGSEPPLI